MKSQLKFGKNLAFIAAFAFFQAAFAQKPVESTHVDEKYANTTVVYKNTTASDKDVLQSIENDFGIGDVIRVTVAPPKVEKVDADPASAPVHADQAKGEDTWLPKKPATTDRQNFSSSASPATMLELTASQSETRQMQPVYSPGTTPINTVVNLAPAKSAALPQPAPKLVQVPEKPVVVENTPAPEAQEVPVRVKTADNARTHSSVKKSTGNKSSHKMKLKNRKHGKQRYACPKF